MKIGGLGEFESIRKAVQKDEPASPKPTEAPRGDSVQREEDAVQISDKAKMLGKLRQVPDVRQNEIERVLAKMRDGTLMTPEVIKESVARLIENIL